MSNETIDMVSKGLWDRARTICITMMQGDTKRTRAERNFSMIQSVVREGDTFKILALNKMAADILEREYAEDSVDDMLPIAFYFHHLSCQSISF